MGYRVIDIGGEAATLENLLDALSKYSFSAVFLGGHGNADTFTGQDYVEIFKACVNDQELSGNIAYLCSCFTGQELGPSMITKNVVAYVGYLQDFRFIIDQEKTPQDDSKTSLAQPFQEIVLEVIRRILKAQMIKDVYMGGIAKCDEWIQELSTRPEYKWSQVISFLQHNRDALISIGERERYAEPPTAITANYIPIVASVGLGAVLTALSVL